MTSSPFALIVVAEMPIPSLPSAPSLPSSPLTPSAPFRDVTSEYNIKVKYIDVSTLNEDDYDEFVDIIDTASTPTIIFYENGEEQ